MRPLFHNFKGTDEDDIDPRVATMWHNYRDINKIFAEQIYQNKKRKDMVWIHDIDLLLAPLYLKRADVYINIGFFFHAPFPSSDIFKTF